jgi:hypothetical protein
MHGTPATPLSGGSGKGAGGEACRAVSQAHAHARYTRMHGTPATPAPRHRPQSKTKARRLPPPHHDNIGGHVRPQGARLSLALSLSRSLALSLSRMCGLVACLTACPRHRARERTLNGRPERRTGFTSQARAGPARARRAPRPPPSPLRDGRPAGRPAGPVFSGQARRCICVPWREWGMRRGSWVRRRGRGEMIAVVVAMAVAVRWGGLMWGGVLRRRSR